MRLALYFAVLTAILGACKESEKIEIYNESNTVVIDGIVYDINEKPINGLYKVYYPNGNVKMEVFSKNGIPEGEGKFYAADGYVLFKGIFSEGKIDGIMFNYYEDGSIRNEISYDKGVLNGATKTYNEAGDLTMQVEYENATAVKGSFFLQGNTIEMDNEDLEKLSQQINNTAQVYPQ